VSRSNRLDLAATRLLSLEAPTLRLAVPQTNKVFVSSGVEFVELRRQQQQQRSEQDSEQDRPAAGEDEQLSRQQHSHRPAGSKAAPAPLLDAFKLVLIDDILMASRD
jgi:hypothetical protein